MTRSERTRASFRVIRYPRLQGQMVDWLAMAGRRHTMHALLELDVTDARAVIRERRARTNEPVSLTGFVVACLARAIAEDPQMQAMQKGRGRLVLFDDVDVTVAVESDVEDAKIPVPHIVRGADRKSVAQVSTEIREARAVDVPYAAARRLLPAWLLIPGAIRRWVWTRWLADPDRRKALTGTTFVTSVGMFGHGSAWGIPHGLNYPVGLTIGGIGRRPGVVRVDGTERIEVRELLSLTVSFDHDVIDGAPAARFVARLKHLIESGAGLATSESDSPRLASPERASLDSPGVAV